MSNIPTMPETRRVRSDFGKGKPSEEIAERQAEDVQRQQDLPLDELVMVDEAEAIEEEEDADVERLECIDAEQFEKGGP